jgi:FkbM family methyltransferase
VRRAIHIAHRLKHAGDSAVAYHLPGGIDIQLYPEGEIAEFLSFPTLFERTEVALVAAFLTPGMRVVDVGANVGLYSIVAQKRVGPGGEVWAFEPSPESFVRLKKSLHLNGCTEVHPFQLALSDQEDTILKLRSAKGFGDAYRYLASNAGGAREDGDYEESVPVTTLDRWASDTGVEGVDFLKVDIEGGEFRMLTGARKVLSSNPDIVVFFENESDWCRRAGHSPEDTIRLLESLGFGVYAWNNRKKTWLSDRHSLLKSTMIWACRKRDALPIV